MNADEIVRALRENAEWCDANEYEVPICMGDNQRGAADLIESLQAQLAESQRRERAAVEDLSQDAHCTLCKHHLSEGGDCYGVSKCAVNGLRVGWEWRGPQEAGEGKTE
jgi:hypothetical protein